MGVIQSLGASWRAMARRVARTDTGASLVEYALLLALIVVVCVAAVSFIGDTANESFSSTGSLLVENMAG